MTVSSEFWRDKRVLVTGHTGFKGSWLSLWLQSLGARVAGYALAPPTNPSLYELANVADGMISITGDVRDFEHLKTVLAEYEPEIIIHMAAQPLVRYSYLEPIETYSTNVMGTVNLLEAVRQIKGIRAVLNVTSDKCYENREWYWGYRENEPMGGYDPYSNSKGCAELVTAAYRSSFFNPDSYKNHGVAVASARAGNVIGGGDWAEDRLIPDFIRSIVRGETVVIRSPNAVRPWQHVLEPLSGYLKLAEALYTHGVEFGEAWNFGPNDSDTKTVEWVISHLVNGWGDGASYKVDKNVGGLHEAHLLKLDCSKAKIKLAWHPKWSAQEAIERICDWHKAHLNGIDMKEYTLQEISRYEKKLTG